MNFSTLKALVMYDRYVTCHYCFEGDTPVRGLVCMCLDESGDGTHKGNRHRYIS